MSMKYNIKAFKKKFVYTHTHYFKLNLKRHASIKKIPRIFFSSQKLYLKK